MPENQVTLAILSERPSVREDQESELDIAIVISAQRESSDLGGQAPAINLCIVIDKSGSMEGTKLEQAKSGSLAISQSMSASDKLSILAFDSNVLSVVNPQTPPEKIPESIRSIAAGGSTNLSAGWYTGLLELQTYATPAHINRLVLLSDGEANAGEQKATVLGTESARAREELGITTSTIGIGRGFQEEILAALSTESGGRFWFIEEARIEDIIKEEFRGALSVVVERPRVELVLPPGIVVHAELNDLPKVSNRYRLRPVKANDRVAFAVRLRVKPAAVENNKITLSATLYERDENVCTTETTIDVVPLQQYIDGAENSDVLAIVETYRARVADEALVDAYERRGTDTIVGMLRAQSGSLGRSSVAPLELEANLLENNSLIAVAHLMALLRGVGEQGSVAELINGCKKLHAHRGARLSAGHAREEADGGPLKLLLSDCLTILSATAAKHPEVPEFATLESEIHAQLAKLS
jgi:hypothetical protein